MAQRESRINGVRLYSDRLDGDNNAKSKTVQTYKKVQTTTKTVTKAGANPSQTTITKKTEITKNVNMPCLFLCWKLTMNFITAELLTYHISIPKCMLSDRSSSSR